MTNDVDEGKTIAIISYLTWVGLLIAFLMNNEKKNAFAKYHIKQALMLLIVGMGTGVMMAVPIIGWIAAPFIMILLLILWVIGILHAINGQVEPVPIIGKYAEQILTF